jgi:biotin carboxyl carrier protein
MIRFHRNPDGSLSLRTDVEVTVPEGTSIQEAEAMLEAEMKKAAEGLSGELPVSGEVLVAVGARVQARDVIARTFIEGDVTPVPLASLLSVPASDVPSLLLVKKGDHVATGDVIARTKGIFGFGKKELASPAAGVVESVSATTGQMMLRGARTFAVQISAH